MTDPDDKLERAYRALAKEEPPAALDAAILAAARRSVARPSFARRWGVPVSIAAVLMLAIGVTLEMQHEKPGLEQIAPSPRGSPTRRGDSTSEGRGEDRASAARSTESRHDRNIQPFAAQRAAPAPAAPPPAPAEAPAAPPVAAQLAPQPKVTAKRESAASASAEAKAKVHDPRADLERIAKLRAEGRDEEADRALEEFRKRFPGYRIDDATWARVKPR
jgi:hypothetical protein